MALQRLQFAAEAHADFEQPHARVLAVEVMAHGADQARPEAGAHDGKLCRQRIGQGQSLGFRVEHLL